jgi:ABC-type multidrug transport system fused ATPase/permease subunit
MRAQVTDFIRPPRILSREAYPKLDEETWSQGEYVEAEIIQQAFNLEEPLREPVGIYLNQPNPHGEKGRQLLLLVPALLIVLIFIQVFSGERAARQQVFQTAGTYQVGRTNPLIVTQPFEIPGGRQALQFTLWAPVANNWIELGIDLVNAATQTVVASFEQGIEYYYGVDGGESWTEGSQSTTHLVPAILPGKYYLTVDASADPAVTEMPFTVTVVRDVLVWSNFWIALCLLLPYPLYCWYRAYRFENARWAESDYSPYTTSGGDDDEDDE